MKLMIVLLIVVVHEAYCEIDFGVVDQPGDSSLISEREYPWIASIKTRFENRYGRSSALTINSADCGGTLISECHVLTSASCLDTLPQRTIVYGTPYDHTQDMRVTFGINDKCSGTPAESARTFGVSRAIKHPSYKHSGGFGVNDIALLTLSERAVGIDAIYLPQPDTTLFRTNVNPFVAGFGFTGENVLPCSLRKTTLQILDRAACRIADVPAIICASAEQTAVCNGDRGVALISPREDGRLVVYGILSRGIQCNAPYLITNVALHTKWIKDAMDDSSTEEESES